MLILNLGQTKKTARLLINLWAITCGTMQEQILIVEPDTKQLKKLREILSREGFSIITVTDRLSAINITKKLQIKYILAGYDVLFCNEKDFETNQSKEEV